MASIHFPEIIPTPSDDSSWAFIAKFVVGTHGLGTVWVRLIGEVGTNRRSNVAGLAADANGVYITGAFTAGVTTNLSYQSCEFGASVQECEPGGRLYDRKTGLCNLQEAYTRAPNQVCAKYNTSILDKHIVRTVDMRQYTSRQKAGMFLASYDHRGVLRWHREAFGGDVSVSALALSRKEDVFLDEDQSKARRTTPFSRRGDFVYVAGNVFRFDQNALDDKGGFLPELTNFGQMRYPLSCSRNKTVDPSLNSSKLIEVGDYTGPSHTPCSGRITSMGSGSDIYLVQFRADNGEPQWLKRFGERDTSEYVTGIDVNRRSATVYMTGSFLSTTPGSKDLFSMENAGRHNLIGCSRWGGPLWNSVSRRIEFEHLAGTNESRPSCKVAPFSTSILRDDKPRALSGFVMEIAEGEPETEGEKPWETFARESKEAAASAQAENIEETGGTGLEIPIIIPCVSFRFLYKNIRCKFLP